MDRQVFYEVLVPLMEVKGTATICISTPLGSSNFYSELTRVVDERGRPIFNVMQIGHNMRPEWKPIEFTLDAFVRNQAFKVRTTFGGGTATSEVTLIDKTSTKTDPVTPDTIVLSNSFYGTYEALAARLAASGRRLVEERFSEEKMVEAVEKLLLSLIHRKAAEASPP
jgi:hypothetical protein